MHQQIHWHQNKATHPQIITQFSQTHSFTNNNHPIICHNHSISNPSKYRMYQVIMNVIHTQPRVSSCCKPTYNQPPFSKACDHWYCHIHHSLHCTHVKDSSDILNNLCSICFMSTYITKFNTSCSCQLKL